MYLQPYYLPTIPWLDCDCCHNNDTRWSVRSEYIYCVDCGTIVAKPIQYLRDRNAHDARKGIYYYGWTARR